MPFILNINRKLVYTLNILLIFIISATHSSATDQNLISQKPKQSIQINELIKTKSDLIAFAIVEDTLIIARKFNKSTKITAYKISYHPSTKGISISEKPIWHKIINTNSHELKFTNNHHNLLIHFSNKLYVLDIKTGAIVNQDNFDSDIIAIATNASESNKIFIKTAKNRTYCLLDNQIIWLHLSHTSRITSDNNSSLSLSSNDHGIGDQHILASYGNFLYLIDKFTGAEIWSKTIYNHNRNNSYCRKKYSSVSISKNKSYFFLFHQNGSLTKIDKNGNALWQISLEPGSSSAPYIINNTNILIQITPKIIYFINIDNGSIIRKNRIRHSTNFNPISINNKTFIFTNRTITIYEHSGNNLCKVNNKNTEISDQPILFKTNQLSFIFISNKNKIYHIKII